MCRGKPTQKDSKPWILNAKKSTLEVGCVSAPVMSDYCGDFAWSGGVSRGNDQRGRMAADLPEELKMTGDPAAPGAPAII